MLIHSLLYGVKFNALEITSKEAGFEYCNFLQLKKKKNTFIVEQKKQFSTIENSLEELTVKNLFLIINNENILLKTTTYLEKDDKKIVFSSFPNIALQDFYYEIIYTEQYSFVAICRKEYVDKLITTFTKKGITITGFSLGNLAIKNVLPFISNQEFYTSNALVKIENGILNTIQKENSEKEQYSINGLELSNNEVLSLGGILSSYLTITGKEKVKNDKNDTLLLEYRQKKLFSFGLYTSLSILFLILLINFFVFSRYFTKVDKLSSEVALNEELKKSLVELQSKVKTKETVLNNLQSVSQSRIASYLDEIAILLPTTIALTEIEYQPINGRLNDEKVIKVFEKQIRVKGITKNDTHFTGLVAMLEKKKWSKKVTVLSFGKNKSNITSFDLLIDVTNE